MTHSAIILTNFVRFWNKLNLNLANITKCTEWDFCNYNGSLWKIIQNTNASLSLSHYRYCIPLHRAVLHKYIPIFNYYSIVLMSLLTGHVWKHAWMVFYYVFTLYTARLDRNMSSSKWASLRRQRLGRKIFLSH